MKYRFLAFWLSGLLAVPTAAWSQNIDGAQVGKAAEVLARPVPVTAGDIGDRPYRVIGRVDTFVQKALWQPTPSDEKGFRELWERARRIGADAVVHATVGGSECSFFSSCGGRRASGEAIHFLTPGELAARTAK